MVDIAKTPQGVNIYHINIQQINMIPEELIELLQILQIIWYNFYDE